MKVLKESSYKSVMSTIAMAVVIFLGIETSLLFLDWSFSINNYAYYLPLILLSIYIVLLFTFRDFIRHFRVVSIYWTVSFIILSIVSTSYLWLLATESNDTLRFGLYVFIGFLCMIFMWDFYKGLSTLGRAVDTYQNNLLKTSKEKNELIAKDIFGSSEEKNSKPIFFKILLWFLMPIVILGKGGAYAFGVGASNFYDIHGLLIFIVVLPVSLAGLLIIEVPAIAIWKLKYPTQEEMEAYSKEKQI